MRADEALTGSLETRADRPRHGFLSAAAQEAKAVMRLAMLLPRDLRLVETVPADVEDFVVLVHGTMASAGAWRPLRADLSRVPRVHATAFTFGPARGVADVAALISEALLRAPATARVHLIGHSLGGLAVRWFVQETEGDARVAQTISVAAPFAGARGASLFPGPAGRDLRAGSDVLTRLGASALRASVPHLSIYGTADTAVDSRTPFPVGDRVIVAGAGHNALLFHPEVTSHVSARLRATRG